MQRAMRRQAIEGDGAAPGELDEVLRARLTALKSMLRSAESGLARIQVRAVG
jgi:hypothetical protein